MSQIIGFIGRRGHPVNVHRMEILLKKRAMMPQNRAKTEKGLLENPCYKREFWPKTGPKRAKLLTHRQIFRIGPNSQSWLKPIKQLKPKSLLLHSASRAPNMNHYAPEIWPWPLKSTSDFDPDLWPWPKSKVIGDKQWSPNIWPWPLTYALAKHG